MKAHNNIHDTDKWNWCQMAQKIKQSWNQKYKEAAVHVCESDVYV
jgi:hypothetical protein